MKRKAADIHSIRSLRQKIYWRIFNSWTKSAVTRVKKPLLVRYTAPSLLKGQFSHNAIKKGFLMDMDEVTLKCLKADN